MMNPPDLEQLIDRVLQGLPAGLHGLKQDFEQQLKAALRQALSRMDLVTREEFDIQREVLLRTRAKLEALEKQLAELEQHLPRAGKPD